MIKLKFSETVFLEISTWFFLKFIMSIHGHAFHVILNR